MKEPQRLVRGEASPLERLLLEASARERPAPELVAKARSALGLPAAQPVALRDTLSSWGPKVLLAIAGAALVGTLVHRTHPNSAPIAPTPVVPAAPTVAPEPAKGSGGPSATEAPTVSIDSLPVAAEPSARPSASSTADTLREEIAQLDKVRSAIRAGSPSQALTELDTYRARFPRGVLQQEALVQRIQALELSGNTAQATNLAQSFLSQHPHSPYAERIAHILGTSTAASH